MAPSQHHNPSSNKLMSSSPYNFVPLPEKILYPGDGDDELRQDNYQGLSGYYEITIETSSPLYIRGMKTADLPEEEKTAFFNVNGNFRIPGSSLRGMFRNLVEIISYSRPSDVGDDRYPYRSVESNLHGRNYSSRLNFEGEKNKFTPKYLAGFMHQVGPEWRICPAQEIEGVTFMRVSHGLLNAKVPGWRTEEKAVQTVNVKLVYVKPGNYEFHSVHGFLQMKRIWVDDINLNESEATPQEAILVTSGPMGKKKSEVLVLPENKRIPRSEWKKINKTVVNSYRTDSIPKFRGVWLAGKNGVLQEGHPVFYILDKDGEVEAFGHCPMMRLPYQNSPMDLLNRDLPRGTTPDLAERMFGYVDQTAYTEKSRAGRIFFEDGIWVEKENPSENAGNAISPKILSTPKPTSFQHYLTQSQPDDRNTLRDYDSSGTSLRGYKMYWAKGEFPDYLASEDRVQRFPRQHTRIKPLSRGNQFIFRLRFDNLTPVELGTLAWIMRIAQDDRYRLRLGMGKPYGLGAIRFVKSEITLIDRKMRYTGLLTAQDEKLNWNTGVIPDCRKQEQVALDAFETWVLSDPDVNPGQKAKTFSDLARIQKLLALLSWPGPNPEKTKYLELNEFRDRKVLPDPIYVHKGAEVSNDDGKDPMPSMVTAEIVDTDGTQVFCVIDGQDENVLGVIPPQHKKNWRFHEGERYRCKVISTSEKNSETFLILDPIQRL